MNASQDVYNLSVRGTTFCVGAELHRSRDAHCAAAVARAQQAARPPPLLTSTQLGSGWRRHRASKPKQGMQQIVQTQKPNLARGIPKMQTSKDRAQRRVDDKC